MAKIKEIRQLDSYELKALCIHKGWYTQGDCKAYENMLAMCDVDNVTANRLYKIASDIKIHSDTKYEISSIMFEVARICNSFFTIYE